MTTEEMSPANSATSGSIPGADRGKFDAEPNAVLPTREPDISQPDFSGGARPRSEITGKHDAGSAANETIDGLNSSDEALRRAVEDMPSREQPNTIEDVPVFDRGDLPPKI
jgi:hypothetical protein